MTKPVALTYDEEIALRRIAGWGPEGGDVVKIHRKLALALLRKNLIVIEDRKRYCAALITGEGQDALRVASEQDHEVCRAISARCWELYGRHLDPGAIELIAKLTAEDTDARILFEGRCKKARAVRQ